MESLSSPCPIEGFRQKADIIAKDNWVTVVRLLGDAGKGVRVAGSGRIAKMSGNGRLQKPGVAAGDKVQAQPSTATGITVSGATGDPAVQGSTLGTNQSTVKKKKKCRRKAKAGTNDEQQSQQMAAANGTSSSAPTPETGTVTNAGETNTVNQSQQMASSPRPPAEPSVETVEVTETVEPQPEDQSASSEPATAKISDTGILTRTMSSRSIAGSEDFVQVEAPATSAAESSVDKSKSPIAKTFDTIGKKIWAHRNK